MACRGSPPPRATVGFGLGPLLPVASIPLMVLQNIAQDLFVQGAAAAKAQVPGSIWSEFSQVLDQYFVQSMRSRLRGNSSVH